MLVLFESLKKSKKELKFSGLLKGSKIFFPSLFCLLANIQLCQTEMNVKIELNGLCSKMLTSTNGGNFQIIYSF